MMLIWISVFCFQHCGFKFVVFFVIYIALTFNQMVCDVNFQNNFLRALVLCSLKLKKGLFFKMQLNLSLELHIC